MYGLPGVWDTPKLRTKCNAGPFFSPNLRVCLGRWLEDPRVELTAMDSKADGHWAILPALHENTVPSPLRCHQLTLSGHLLCGGGGRCRGYVHACAMIYIIQRFLSTPTLEDLWLLGRPAWEKVTVEGKHCSFFSGHTGVLLGTPGGHV